MGVSKLAALGLMVAALILGVGAAPLPAAAQGQPQTTCPVLGGNINKSVYVDYQGQRVYFCCPGCEPKFRQDPEKFVKKMEAQGVTLEKCPVTPEKSGK